MGARAGFDQLPQADIKERFYRYFQGEVTGARLILVLLKYLLIKLEIQERISLLESFSVGGERQDAIDSSLASISGLSTEVADASEFLPAYDQRTYGQVSKSQICCLLLANLSRLLKASPKSYRRHDLRLLQDQGFSSSPRITLPSL